MIDGLLDSGAMPALERLTQLTHERHKLIAHSVANLSTPYFRPRDLDVADFQKTLGEAIDRRRQRTGGPNGELAPDDTDQLRFRDAGLAVRPQYTDENILFHDRNNRSLEHLMQDLAENAMMHNTALELLRNQFAMMTSAIRERV